MHLLLRRANCDEESLGSAAPCEAVLQRLIAQRVVPHGSALPCMAQRGLVPLAWSREDLGMLWSLSLSLPLSQPLAQPIPLSQFLYPSVSVSLSLCLSFSISLCLSFSILLCLCLSLGLSLPLSLSVSGATEAQAYTLIDGNEWLATPKFDGLNLVGKAFVGEFQIRDSDTKQPVPHGTIGEVWMRHHEQRLTYYYRGGNGQRQAESDEHGWETVGDMGMLDEGGYLHLGDRKADMVLIGGVNVWPAEVEAVLEQHPAVRSAVVVGVPHSDLGSQLHAIVYTGTQVVAVEELRAFAAERLARVKVPQEFSFAQSRLHNDAGS